MRRPFLPLAIVAGVAWVATGTAQAVEYNIRHGMVHKATHGVVNFGTGVWEIAAQTKKGYCKGLPRATYPSVKHIGGGVCGFFRGCSHAVGRTGWGVLQLVGFWSANPLDNRDVLPLLDSEYAWEEGTKKKVFSPSFSRGVSKISNRVGRGVRNLLFGIFELPGQVCKARSEERGYVTGITKGVWYTFSRGIYGVGDIFLFFVPIPVENRGVAFDENWPSEALRGHYYTTDK